jgi:hypothetical protein
MQHLACKTAVLCQDKLKLNSAAYSDNKSIMSAARMVQLSATITKYVDCGKE